MKAALIIFLHLFVFCLALLIITSVVGIHQAAYTLPDGTVLVQEGSGGGSLYMADGREIKPVKTNDYHAWQVTGGVGTGIFGVGALICLMAISD